MSKRNQSNKKTRRVLAMVLAMLMIFSFSVNGAVSKDSGIIEVSAASKFTYDGKNISKFKGSKTFVVSKNVTSKNLSSIKSAYKKNSTSFSKVTKVEFGDSVTMVTADIFACFPNVKTIVLGKKVVEVPESDGFLLDGVSVLTKLTTFEVDSKNSSYSAKDGILYNKNKSKLVKIPEAFTKSSYAMPESVTKVAGDYSIYNCSKLTTLSISKSFEGNLRKLNTLANLTTITVVQGSSDYVALDGVLYNADQTKLICWPTGKKTQNVTFPDTLKSLDTDQLPAATVTMTIPKDLESIYSDDQSSNYYGKKYPLNVLKNLASVTVADGNSHFVMEGGALYNAKKTVCYGIPMKSSITEIRLAEGLTAISSQLLYNHATITKLTISSTIKTKSTLLTYIFGGDDTLEALTEYAVAEENEIVKAVDGVLYSKDGKSLLCYPIAKAGSEFVVPDEVENIYGMAFSDKCKGLTKLTFGKGVKALGGEGINLPNLAAYAVSDENNTFCARDGVLYDKSLRKICGYPKKKTDKSFVVDEKVQYMAYYGTFANDYLKELDIQGDVYLPDKLSQTLPKLESITAGGNSDFKSANGVLYNSSMTTLMCYPACKDSTEYIIPDSVTRIVYGAMTVNSYLKKIVLGKKLKNIDLDYWMYGYTKLTKIEVNAKNANFASKDGVLYNKKYTTLKAYPAGKKTKTYTLPKTVKTISLSTDGFLYNKYLKKLKVEKGSKYYTSDGKTITNLKKTKSYSVLKNTMEAN